MEPLVWACPPFPLRTLGGGATRKQPREPLAARPSPRPLPHPHLPLRPPVSRVLMEERGTVTQRRTNELSLALGHCRAGSRSPGRACRAQDTSHWTWPLLNAKPRPAATATVPQPLCSPPPAAHPSCQPGQPGEAAGTVGREVPTPPSCASGH